MVYLPIGLAPRLSRLPLITIFLALGFLVSSISMEPHLDRHNARIKKLQSRQVLVHKSEWLNPHLAKSLKAAPSLRIKDPKLHPLIYQKQKKNFSALSLNPWIVPKFSMLMFVILSLALFGGFVENRLGSGLFGTVFISVYYLGYLTEAYLAPTDVLLFGGTTSVFILAGAYLALFPLRDLSLWLGDDIRPWASLPVWTSVCLFLIGLESVGWGGYLFKGETVSTGYAHLSLLLTSYFAFRFAGTLRKLPPAYLSLREVKLVRRLERALGPEALRLMKQLLKYNPSHLDPIDIYYRRVIEPLSSSEPLSPENKRFLEKYLCLLVAHHYDREDFSRIANMLKARPIEVLPANFFKLLFAKEWLDLARHLDRLGEWSESLFVYATCLDYFADLKLRAEALKRAEVLIHRKFKECIDDPLRRPHVLRLAKKFVKDHPRSKVSRILLDHVQHMRNVVRSQSNDSDEVA